MHVVAQWIEDRRSLSELKCCNVGSNPTGESSGFALEEVKPGSFPKGERTREWLGGERCAWFVIPLSQACDARRRGAMTLAETGGDGDGRWRGAGVGDVVKSKG